MNTVRSSSIHTASGLFGCLGLLALLGACSASVSPMLGELEEGEIGEGDATGEGLETLEESATALSDEGRVARGTGAGTDDGAVIATGAEPTEFGGDPSGEGAGDGSAGGDDGQGDGETTPGAPDTEDDPQFGGEGAVGEDSPGGDSSGDGEGGSDRPVVGPGDGTDSITCVSCAPPREGCRYSGGNCERCGELECEDEPPICVACEAPPEGCAYVGGNCDSCGELECEDEPPICVACEAPPEGCAYVGGNCESCGELECDCDRMEARGQGQCLAFFGYVWDGDSCEGIGGCNCVGRDCDRTYGSPEACEAAHQGCKSDGGDGGGIITACGTRGGVQCADNEYCEFGTDENACGATDIGGVCLPRPEICTADCPGVCGCDGKNYCNACGAAGAGTDTAHEGNCGDAPEPDCRQTGCDEGDYCTFCWVDYACIPEGAVC